MPIYEYECKKCGEFEVTQRITEPALTRCPTCRSKVTKLISNTSFQLKGSGWYITDYGRKDGAGKGKAKEPSSEAKTDSAPSSDTKSETKSESKSDTKASKQKEAAAA